MQVDNTEYSVVASGLSRTYNLGNLVVRAVSDVTLRLRRRTINVFVGPSGSGKSTLLALLGLLEAPDPLSAESNEPVFRFDDTCVRSLCTEGRARMRASKVGFLFQDARLIEQMTIFENVALPLTYRGICRSEREDRAYEALCRVGLSERASSTPCRLSGGERQRAALARAIVSSPSLLICDEPTAALDEELSLRMRDLLREVSLSGVTTVIATHDPVLIDDSDSLHALNRGRLAHVESGEELLQLGLRQMAAIFAASNAAASARRNR